MTDDNLVRVVAEAIGPPPPAVPAIDACLTAAQRVLRVEVEPGVTVRDALRAYLALVELVKANDTVECRDYTGVASSYRFLICLNRDDVRQRSSMAAAILAAAGVPDGG